MDVERTMNEATFEAHLAGTLKEMFPTIDETRIHTQKTFTLKFGHAIHPVDGPASYIKGRADIILFLDDVPTVLFELKRPDLSLTEDDVAQGISYARLHEPMIPIVVVTNGADVRIHSSFDRSNIGGSTLDEERIAKIIKISAEQARLGREEAIRNLLEGSPTTWAHALRSRTDHSLAELRGSSKDLTRPLCSDFRFPRRATVALAAGFAVGQRSLALVGPPLSGKTNVISELCDRSEEFGLAPLYIDCADAEDLLEEIVAALSESFGASISKDTLSQWLRIGAGEVSRTRPRLVLVLDSLSPEESAPLVKQATNILRNAGPNIAILLALTESGLETIRVTPGRTTFSKLGRDTKIVPLERLDGDEIDAAATTLLHQTRIAIPPGSRFELTMHDPRTIRLMIAMHGGRLDVPEGQYVTLPSIVPSNVLKKLWATTTETTELRADLLSLANAYLEEIEGEGRTAELILASMGIGSMSLRTVESNVTEAGFERLLKQGHIKRFSLGDEIIIVPTVPGLLSAALPTVIRPRIIEIARSEGHDAATLYLLRTTRDVALGDRVAAIVLEQLLAHESELLSSIVSAFITDEPLEEKMYDGNFLIQLPNGQQADMRYANNSITITLPGGEEAVIPMEDEEGEGRFATNLHPWNILSHLAYVPMWIETERGPGWLGTVIMNRVGRYRGTLKSFGPATLGEQNAVYQHWLPGFGEVPCPSQGIVEPIVYAMQVAIQNAGEEMEAFVEQALAAGDPALLLRLQTAAASLDTIVDSEIRGRAQKMNERLLHALRDVLEAIHGNENSE
jgi:hypothetical protein